MTVFIIVVIAILLIEITGLLFVVRYMNRKIVNIEDQLNRFNRNATAFVVDARSYLSQRSAEMIMEDIYKERALTSEDLYNIMKLWEKSFH